MIKLSQYILLFLLLFLWATTGSASTLTIPNTFTAGTTAVAANVNDNFTAVKTSVDDNDARIVTLEAKVLTLESKVSTLEDQLNNLTTGVLVRLEALEASGSNTLNSYMTIDSSSGYTTVLFSGVNLQVTNGAAQTTANGLGNIIIGKNDVLTNVSATPVCSNAAYSTDTSCIGAGEVWSINHKTGSHNLIVGPTNSYSSTGAIVSGADNIVTSTGASVIGGILSTATGESSIVLGGRNNTANAGYSTVVGGKNNITARTCVNSFDCNYATITGGDTNTTSGYATTVSGGYLNTVSGTYGAVNGGTENNVQLGSFSSTINGGSNNVVSGQRSAIGGGSMGSVTANDSWRGGVLTSP